MTNQEQSCEMLRGQTTNLQYRLQTIGVSFEDADRPKKPVNVRNMANGVHTGQGCDFSAQSGVRLLLVFMTHTCVPFFPSPLIFSPLLSQPHTKRNLHWHRSRSQGDQKEPESRDEVILDDEVLTMKDEISFKIMIILCGKVAKRD